MSADKKPNTEALRHGENKKSLKQGGEEEQEGRKSPRSCGIAVIEKAKLYR
jgi:hypothetical protein